MSLVSIEHYDRKCNTLVVLYEVSLCTPRACPVCLCLFSRKLLFKILEYLRKYIVYCQWLILKVSVRFTDMLILALVFTD